MIGCVVNYLPQHPPGAHEMALATAPTTQTLTPAHAAAVARAEALRAVGEFAGAADAATIEATAAGLRAKGYAVHVVDTGAEARDLILDLLPDGAEVGQGASTTLDEIG